MSEKRFEFYSDENLVGVIDTVTGRTFNSFEIVDRLNEQQAEIERLKKELDNFKPVMFQDMRKGTVILYSKGG